MTEGYIKHKADMISSRVIAKTVTQGIAISRWPMLMDIIRDEVIDGLREAAKIERQEMYEDIKYRLKDFEVLA